MKIKTETIVRTAIAALIAIWDLLLVCGVKVPAVDDNIINAISAILSIVIGAWIGWKNNSFTPAAIAADEYMTEMKDK